MDISYRITIVLLFASLIMASEQVVYSQDKPEKKNGDIWTEEVPESIGGRRHKHFKVTEEMVARTIESLRKDDPERANRLEALRKKEPEKYEAEIRDIIIKEYFRAKHAEYLEWLEENYPQEAEKLSRIQENKPEEYGRMIGLSLGTYRRIFEADKDDPNLARILKEDLELRREVDRLVEKIKSVKDERQKKEITAQLNNVVSRRYDLLVERTRIAYERLIKKLEEAKKQEEEKLKKWKDPKFKQDSIETHVKELINGPKKFHWN